MDKKEQPTQKGTHPGFLRPTTTPTPDELFDVWLSVLAGAELKVLLYIVRRTLGFKKDADAISLRQICDGISTKDGTVLDRGTGLARKTAFQAVQSLEGRGLITVDRQLAADGDNQINVYRLAFVEPDALTSRNHAAEIQPRRVDTKSTYGRYQKEPRVGTKDTPQQTVLQETVLQEEQQQESPNQPATFDVVVALTGKGISRSVARKLASKYPADLITDKIDLLDFLQETRSSLIKKNPAGYLRKAIEENYEPPKGFKSKAQREADQEAKQALARRIQEQDDKRAQDREAAWQHWREQLIAQHQIADEQQALWQKIKDKVGENQSIGRLKYWLDESMLLSQQGGKAVVAFRYAYPARRLAESVVGEVESALSEELQRPITVSFKVIADSA